MLTIRRDIETREDIALLLSLFYEKVLGDEVIRHFFTEVVPLNLEHHLPVIADFWEAVLFSKQGYRKDVMEVHLRINQKSGITRVHLDRWVHLFTQTVDETFEGNKADLAKQRAHSIATLMDIKMNHYKQINNPK